MFRFPNVPEASQLIELAFSQGAKKAKMARGRGKNVPDKVLTGEIRRVEAMAAIFEGELNALSKHFPQYEELNEFQQALLDLRISKDKYKKSLATAKWCAQRIESLKNKTLRKLKTKKDPGESKAFMGRSSSFVKRINKDLKYLREAKKTLINFPTIKQDCQTLVVAGVPNAGKSTYTKTLTGSKVKVASYPFTTVDIMVGYKKIRYIDYQIIDSPGILDRPMKDRNTVELQAVLALKYLATAILYIIDNTQELMPQENLLKEIKESFELPVYAYVNDKGGQEIKGYETFNAQDEKQCLQIMKKCLKLK